MDALLERVPWWLTWDWWAYLFERRRDPDIPWWRVLRCRWRGHPAGVRWHNVHRLEPDMRCKGCGDDLG